MTPFLTAPRFARKACKREFFMERNMRHPEFYNKTIKAFFYNHSLFVPMNRNKIVQE